MYLPKYKHFQYCIAVYLHDIYLPILIVVVSAIPTNNMRENNHKTKINPIKYTLHVLHDNYYDYRCYIINNII